MFPPAFTAAGVAQHDELLDAAQLIAHALYRLHVVGMDAQNFGAGVRRDVDEILGREPVVDGHQHRADLRHRIERFELLACVGRDIGDTIALPDAHRLQRRRPAVAAREELLVGQAYVAVDNGLTVAV